MHGFLTSLEYQIFMGLGGKIVPNGLNDGLNSKLNVLPMTNILWSRIWHLQTWINMKQDFSIKWFCFSEENSRL